MTASDEQPTTGVPESQTGGEPRDTGAPQPGGDESAVSAQDVTGQEGRPGGEPEVHPDASGSFGDAAAEMANETEVESSGTDEPEDQAEADDLTLAKIALSERTLDLQRLQAEYLNYKRRVERDRELVQQNATFAVLSGLLPVLDDIDRAREHGELEGGFKAVADSLERIVNSLGLRKFGTKGDEFDPNIHEALMHGHSPDVSTTTVDVVAHAGYRIGERVVRAAKVTVLDPES